MNPSVLEACQAGIEAWKQAFNRQDSQACAAQYAIDTTMVAKPFGTFEGREQIQAFWQNIIEQGFADVAYTDTVWEQRDEKSYVLTSKWTMNKAFGVVHKEVWTVQDDGKARLTYDEFEVQGER